MFTFMSSGTPSRIARNLCFSSHPFLQCNSQQPTSFCTGTLYQCPPLPFYAEGRGRRMGILPLSFPQWYLHYVLKHFLLYYTVPGFIHFSWCLGAALVPLTYTKLTLRLQLVMWSTNLHYAVQLLCPDYSCKAEFEYIELNLTKYMMMMIELSILTKWNEGHFIIIIIIQINIALWQSYTLLLASLCSVLLELRKRKRNRGSYTLWTDSLCSVLVEQIKGGFSTHLTVSLWFMRYSSTLTWAMERSGCHFSFVSLSSTVSWEVEYKLWMLWCCHQEFMWRSDAHQMKVPCLKTQGLFSKCFLFSFKELLPPPHSLHCCRSGSQWREIGSCGWDSKFERWGLGVRLTYDPFRMPWLTI